MQWTDRQKEVIEKKNTDLLVAAAAGSGKTAVLVEKIKRLVIDEKTGIDRFLVVTFTRAAAAEMKEKIADALMEQGEKNNEDSSYLHEQLGRLSTASISTFDAFAIDIIRNYFYIIDADPDLQICSPEESAILSREAMDETFEILYGSGDTAVMDFMDAYGHFKNDDDLKAALMTIYYELMSMPEGLKWLENALKMLSFTTDEFAESPLMDEIIVQCRQAGKEAKELMEKAYDMLISNGLPRLAEKMLPELALAENVSKCDRTGFSILMDVPRLATIKPTNDEKESFDPIKDEVKYYRGEGRKKLKDTGERFFSDSFEESLDEMKKLIPYTETLYGILKQYEEIFRKKKQKKGLMDFSDANHFALEILQDQHVAKELSERFDYIFIDEYQDSNYIQEAIISAISRGDNVFMVGDIKQSIYRFRLAEPDIFKEKYEDFSADQGAGTKIDLNTNFRSKREVIDAVNSIFSEIMEGYDENAMLYQGDSYDGEISHDTELHIIDTNDKDMDEELALLKNIEFEAMMCAEIIKENLGKMIFDSKLGRERPLEKGDIVILLRNAKNRAGLMYDVLMNAGIETFLEENNGFFDAVEIMTIVDLLKVIDNRHNDIALLSVLRSGIFGFSVDDLVRIRLSCPKGDFYSAFAAYNEDPDLSARVAHTMEILDSWWERSVYHTMGELIPLLLNESGYYAYAGALPGGKQRQANLRSFIDKALHYDSRGNGTIFGFLKYIETIRTESSNPLAPMTGEGEDAVRIMTVHKSKGLEFPMVIVCQTGDGLKTSSIRKEGTWHKDLGFALRYVDADEHYSHDSLLAKIISGRKEREDIQEEIRVFYVACTRAKEKLVLVASRGSKAGRSYLSMMEKALEYSDIRVFEYDALHFKDMAENKMSSRKKDFSSVPGIHDKDGTEGSKDIMTKIRGMLEYEYPEKEKLALKSKYSVSELNAEGKKDYSMEKPKFAQGDKKITGASFGTLMHAVMEYTDFDVFFGKMDEGKQDEYIEKVIAEMRDEYLIDEDEAEAVDREKIKRFFESQLGSRLREAADVHKERQFNILHEKDGSEIIVQGIIDCYFEEILPDGTRQLILVDYKTNYNTEGIEDLYRGQMDLYSEALEKSTGLKVAEKYLYLFSEDRALKV